MSLHNGVTAILAFTESFSGHKLGTYARLCFMLIGYARISKDESNHVAQVGELTQAGCERIEQETASGARWDRPKLQAILAEIGENDILVVWKLDRLSRSLKDLLSIMETLAQRKAGFRSLTEAIDTTSPAGRMMMQIVGAFAEFEREMIRARTKAGLETAKKAGRVGGPPFKFNPLKVAQIVRLITSGEATPTEVARAENCHPKTIHRLLERERIGKSA
jgi:DNA invertase Pin-like site-specific DNA recombinase